MSNYSKTTDFAAKDSLPSGDSGKIIRGSEFETEFDNISTAIATKADAASPTFTGTVTIDGLTVNGNTILGNAATDTVTVTADIASNLIPSADDTYNLGASGAEWNDLYVDGTAYIDDISGGSISGTSFASTGNMTFGDNNKAIFGAGSDLEIYHDGTHSYIKDAGTGNFIIEAADYTILRGANSNLLFAAGSGQGITGYYNGSAKLATTSTGVDVTGTVTADGLTVDGNADVNGTLDVGTSSSGVFNLVRPSTNYIRANETGGAIAMGVSDSIRLFTGQASGEFLTNERLRIASNGDISFYEDTGTTAKLTWDASAESLNVAGNLSVDGGTIKLDGNYPVGSFNVALGNAALDSLTTGDNSVAVGHSALTAATTGGYNVAVGRNVLSSLTSGGSNVSIGGTSMQNNTTGSQNVAIGRNALLSNTTANNNVGIGFSALQSATTGHGNVAIGMQTGDAITTGYQNTLVGQQAGSALTAANHNTAIGYRALFTNTTASNNIAVGGNSLGAATTGSENVAVGKSAASTMTTASGNVALGFAALQYSTSSNNVAIGKQAMQNSTSGTQNVAIGAFALDAVNTGSYQTAVGYGTLSANTSGNSNTALGFFALNKNTTASRNTAVGYNSLTSNLTGSDNTAVGYDALSSATGQNNTAVGKDSLKSLTTGSHSVAVGNEALSNVTTGTSNTALGSRAGQQLTTGTFNVAVGRDALFSATTDGNNIAMGYRALQFLTGSGGGNLAFGYESQRDSVTGNYNVSMGNSALQQNTTGDRNVAIGAQALQELNVINDGDSYNIAVGYQAGRGLTTGTFNTVVGSLALDGITTQTKNTVLGYSAASNKTSGDVGIYIGIHAGRTDNGSNNIAIGEETLRSNSNGGSHNIAIGHDALYNFNSTNAASMNIAIGRHAGRLITTAVSNTIIGGLAGGSITTGTGNTVLGRNAGTAITTATYNTVLGDNSGSLITTGQKNTILGRFNGNQGGLDIRTSNNHIVLSDGDGNPRVVVDSSGNLLIGVTSTTLQGGNITLPNSGIVAFHDAAGNARNALQFVSGELKHGAAAAGLTSQTFYTASAERMRLDSSGRLIVGATVLPTSGTAGVSLQSGGNVHCGLASTSAADVMRFDNPNGRVGSITVGGSTTTYNTSSDERLKENIADADDAGAVVDAIQVRKFDWISDGEHQRYGMVAQELNTVAPEAVTEGETADDMMGVDYSKLVPMLVKEVQSLRARVAQLEGEN